MYQIGKTPLLLATARNHLPVVEYLMERGADMEANDIVSDAIEMKPRMIIYSWFNVLGWIHSIDDCCKARLFISACFSLGERS